MADGRLISARCTHCSYRWPDPVVAAAEPAGTPCPGCGALGERLYDVLATEEVRIYEFTEVKEASRFKKPRVEVQSGSEQARSSERWMDKYRRIDRERDLYDEVVVDQETGEVVHECHEPLSVHRHRGSAKSGPPTV